VYRGGCELRGSQVGRGSSEQGWEKPTETVGSGHCCSLVGSRRERYWNDERQKRSQGAEASSRLGQGGALASSGSPSCSDTAQEQRDRFKPSWQGCSCSPTASRLTSSERRLDVDVSIASSEFSLSASSTRPQLRLAALEGETYQATAAAQLYTMDLIKTPSVSRAFCLSWGGEVGGRN
jgi:hypothetical protein